MPQSLSLSVDEPLEIEMPPSSLPMSAEPRPLTREERTRMRIPYAARNIEGSVFGTILGVPESPGAGDLALARLEKIGKNARLELANGRPCTLHEGDLLTVVFGNRYATNQFEGYAGARGASCDLMSMGGLAGLVESRHLSIPEPSKLRIVGALGDANGRPLSLRSFALSPPARVKNKPRVVVVCGSSMDSGKTHTASSLILGLRKLTDGVAGIKLTGTAAGRDTWSMLDAGACAALDFVDGGYPSTYLVGLEELLALHEHLLGHAAERGASWVVVEIADGILQGETAALIRSPEFARTVDAWLFAAGDPLAALSGAQLMRSWGIEPAGITGRVTMSTLAMREVAGATNLPVFSSPDLQSGVLNSALAEAATDAFSERAPAA
jgi:hypothetical protein